MGTGVSLFHIGLSKKVQSKLLFMVLKTYIIEMKKKKHRPRYDINESAVNNSNKVSWYRGMPVFLTNWSRSGSFFAITLSRYNLKVRCDDNPDELNEDWDPWILRHEWGHGVQAWQLGALWYGLIVGMPSIANWNERADDHPSSYYEAGGEKRADILGSVKRDIVKDAAVSYISQFPAPRVVVRPVPRW